MPRRPKSTFMITYRCRCGMEFGRTEQDVPQCSFCSATDGFTEVKSEELTPEVLFAALTRSVSNLTAALDGAWEAGEREGMDDAEETMLLVELYDALVIDCVRTVHPVHNLARRGRKTEPGYFYWNRLGGTTGGQKQPMMRKGFLAHLSNCRDVPRKKCKSRVRK